MVRLIESYGLRIEESDCFAMVQEGNDRYITVPKNMSMDNPQNAYSLAHELGHYLQYQNKPEWLTLLLAICRRIDKRYHFITYPLIMLEELDAWCRAFKICMKEKDNMLGFLFCAANGIISYAKGWLYSAMKLGKDLIMMYITSIMIYKLGPFTISDITIETSTRLEAFPLLLQIYTIGMFVSLIYHSTKAFAGSVAVANKMDRK